MIRIEKSIGNLWEKRNTSSKLDCVKIYLYRNMEKNEV